jgi:hypothetical protein
MRKGQKHSEETRAKMSARAQQRSERWRQNQTLAQSGDRHWRKGKRSTRYGHNVATKRREIKRHAVERELPWTITDDEADDLIVSDCRYCGKSSKLAEDRSTVQSTRGLNGIDRIDSSLGYVPGNVVSCCGRCNAGKWTDSYAEFVAWIELLHSRLSERTSARS